MKRIVLSVTGSAIALVGGLFGVAVQPVLAQKNYPGKTVSVGGINGCDCHASASECWCQFNS